MKQKFTSEKHKYLENKSMFNFKISCLMKKSLFKLMMTLAIVFGLSFNSVAQTTDNNDASRYIMITGSTHTFSVDANANASNEWVVYKEGTPDAEATATDIVSYAQGSGDSYQVNWAESAGGNYYVQVTQRRNDEGDGENCAVTIRRFFVTIYDFDVEVYISDLGGTKITGSANLAECGEGTVANYGDVGPGNAFSNNFDVVNSALASYVGENPRTTRYVSLRVTWDGDVVSPPAIGSMQFNYVATVSSDLYSVNGVTTDPASGTIAKAVNGDTGDDALTVTFAVVFDDRWGTDITSFFEATNTRIYSSADASTLPLGVEPVSKEVAQGHAEYLPNTTEIQTILAAPATSPIGVTQNE